MAKEWAKGFYKSKAWLECRAAYIKHVLGLCERCGVPGYIVHHKEELNPNNINDPYITLSWDNLEYLCLDCHNKHHDVNREKKPITKDEYKFNRISEKGLYKVKIIYN